MTDPLERVRDSRLRDALGWLRARTDQELTSAQLRESLPGFRAQQGIYKPGGSDHVLWVRETLRGAYPDHDPDPAGPDGSWRYRYAPEGPIGQLDLSRATNRAMEKARVDGVPIGVLRQTSAASGRSTYQVLGLAFVERFDGSHFVLRGEPMDFDREPGQAPPPSFEPFEAVARFTEQMRRVRDTMFGGAVRRAYKDRCATCSIGYRVRGRAVGLEAAHIVPIEENGNRGDVRNGILLCRNHHALMDSYAWTMDEDLRVQIADDQLFRNSAVPNHILEVEGHRIPNLPDDHDSWPDPRAVKIRMELFERAWN